MIRFFTGNALIFLDESLVFLLQFDDILLSRRALFMKSIQDTAVALMDEI